MDSCVSPTCLHVYLKASKTDPFRKGYLIHIGRSNPLLVQQACFWLGRRGPFLKRLGNFPGPKANFKVKTCWILAQFLAHKPVNFVSFSKWCKQGKHKQLSRPEKLLGLLRNGHQAWPHFSFFKKADLSVPCFAYSLAKHDLLVFVQRSFSSQ